MDPCTRQATVAATISQSGPLYANASTGLAIPRRGGQEVSPGKFAELRTGAVATTRATRRVLGFAAAGQLTQRCHAL